MPKQKHTVEEVHTDLEIEEDLNLHEMGWKVQRIGWFFILMLIILAAFGFFGDGLASKKTHSGTGTKIEYERFFRHEARMELKVDLNNMAGHQQTIAFPINYLKHFRIESILPEPKENRAEGNEIQYLFEGTAPLNIVFYLVPQKAGNINGGIRVNEQQFSLTHFIYP